MSSGLHEFKNDLPDEHFEVGIVKRCQYKMHHLQLSIKWHEAGELETLQLNTRSLYHLSGCPPKSGPASLGSLVNLPFFFVGEKDLMKND